MANPFDQFDNPVSGNSNPFDQYDTVPATTQQKGDSFLDRVAVALSKRGANISKSMSEPLPNSGLPSSAINPVDMLLPAGGRLFRSAGQIAGGINDIIGAGLMSGYKTLVPDDIQKNISSFGARVAESAAPMISPLVEGYGNIKKEYPQDIGNLESALNIASMYPTLGAIKSGTQTIKNAGSVVKGAVTPQMTVKTIDEAIDKSVINGIRKGIKPSNSAAANARFYDSAKTAVRDIIEYSDVPLSKSKNVLDDFYSAVRNTKKQLWSQVEDISRGAGANGARVDLKPVLDDMLAVADNMYDSAANPALADALKPYIINFEKLIETEGRYILPSKAEDMISKLNATAKPFWKDPSSHTKAASVERIAQVMRKQTLNAMDDLRGAEYDAFKKRYGAQMAIEKEVANRANVVGRRADFGFFDLANIPSAAEFAASVASGNPVGVAKGGAMLAVKELMKRANDPSNIIRKMFKDVETLNALKKTKVPTPPDRSGIMPTPLSLPMPERGFTLKGKPYPDEILRPTKTPSDIIDADFTSYTRGLLDQPRRDATLLLPNGQGFEMPRPQVPMTLNAQGEGFMMRPSGAYEGLSNEEITRILLRQKR